ncbi:hypothetical protein E2C01_094144 [Portunus trituberculatus]|uniref:Uncharacterized protein n=1 Tax=Portunus trituberculatus TaxID=210409 RepID=A0A5B7JWE0_PORTR|nr:hypothetical protein [Portunus trituberculatus]
MYTWSSKE